MQSVSKCLLISVAYLCFPHPEKMKIHGRKQALTRPMSPLLSTCDISSYSREYSSQRIIFSSCLSYSAAGCSFVLPNCLQFPFHVIMSFAIDSNCSHVGLDFVKSLRDTCALFAFVAASLQTSKCHGVGSIDLNRLRTCCLVRRYPNMITTEFPSSQSSSANPDFDYVTLCDTMDTMGLYDTMDKGNVATDNYRQIQIQAKIKCN